MVIAWFMISTVDRYSISTFCSAPGLEYQEASREPIGALTNPVDPTPTSGPFPCGEARRFDLVAVGA